MRPYDINFMLNHKI